MQTKPETKVGLFILIALGIFFYMSFHLGVFRFDRSRYRQYIVYFDDVSGLNKKADVKIAGVKVGWVEGIELVEDHEYQAKARAMVYNNYVLHEDAYALVKQEGLLGTKYLEIVPGNPLLPPLPANQPLDKPACTPASIDDILRKVQTIANNVEGITDSLQHAVGGQEGREQLRMTMDNIAKAADKFASFAEVLDRTLSHNEETINTVVHDFKELIPSFKSSVERITDVFDRDFNRLATSLEDAAGQARDGFKSINSVAEKIDEGRGLIGKLINEEETYQDLKFAVRGAKNYFAKIDALSIVIDSHGEFMFRPAEHFHIRDAKGYFGMRIHPNDEYFYVFQIVNSLRGNLQRRILRREWFDEQENPLLPSELIAKGVFIPELVGKVYDITRYPDSKKYSLQVGKIFKNIALRFGLFESFAGFGVDFDIPFGTDKFRWVSTFEMFDFRGRDRIHDDRPHLKWINRLFLLRNIYMVFGADDFVSRKNANAFFGTGIRFSDDDIKYIGSKFGLSSFTS